MSVAQGRSEAALERFILEVAAVGRSDGAFYLEDLLNFILIIYENAGPSLGEVLDWEEVALV